MFNKYETFLIHPTPYLHNFYADVLMAYRQVHCKWFSMLLYHLYNYFNGYILNTSLKVFTETVSIYLLFFFSKRVLLIAGCLLLSHSSSRIHLCDCQRKTFAVGNCAFICSSIHSANTYRLNAGLTFPVPSTYGAASMLCPNIRFPNTYWTSSWCWAEHWWPGIRKPGF